MEENELINLVEKITMTGKPTLETNLLKQIKKACKKNDNFLSPVFQTIMKQLKRKHSEIRLSSFQLLIEIFERSHNFRIMVLEELQFILNQTLETNNTYLPPPKLAAKKLRTLSAETMHSWKLKFGSTYRKLEHGYNYLRQVKRASFNDIEGRSELERRREEEKTLKMNNIWKERVKKIRQEMDDHHSDVHDCLTLLNNCVELLLPKNENFLFGEDEQSNNNTEEPDDDDDLKHHGILDASTKISIDINLELKFKITEDNKEIFSNLKDQHTLFSNKYYPMIKKWLVTLTKAGENCESNFLRKVIDLKVSFDNTESKLKPFEDQLKLSKHNINEINDEDSGDDDDDAKDFIEVREKSGYEATVRAEDHLLGIDFYSRPSTSKAFDAANTTSTKPKSTKKVEYKSIPLKPEEYIQNNQLQSSPIKILANPDLNCKWSSSREDDVIEVQGPSSTPIEIPGQFEDIKWTCRAPLPTGKLCPRMDRFKCPFHGKIVPRNNMGNPSNESDKNDIKDTNFKDDWQDPELMKDIEAATGISLQIPTKRKGKRRFHESGLTNIKEKQNTTRKRLEKIVFNRSALKKVADDVHKNEMKKYK